MLQFLPIKIQYPEHLLTLEGVYTQMAQHLEEVDSKKRNIFLHLFLILVKPYINKER